MDDFDIMGELDGVTLDEPQAKPIDLTKHYVMKINKIERKKFDPPKDSGATVGREVISVQYEIASGDFKGRKVYTDYSWNVPMAADESGVKSIVANPNTVERLMSEGMSAEDATARNIEGQKQQVLIGRTKVKKLINAAGFIDAKDVKEGDTNTKRLEAGTAQLIDAGFTLGLIEGRYVMASLQAGYEKTKKDGSKASYPEVKNTWDVDPTKVGDVAELPF